MRFIFSAERLISLAASLVTASSLVTLPGSARSTSVVKLTDEGLVRSSSRIYEGRVASVRSDWNPDRTQIHTFVTIDVSGVYKGPRPRDGVLTLRLLGGRVGDTVMELVGGPVFSEEEDVIVFLEGDATGLMPVTGSYQGKFTIVTDAVTGERMVAERALPRDAFVEAVRRTVAAQEGGR